MIDPAFLDVLRTLYTRLHETDINWAVTGSFCFALQGVPMPEVHDIDLQSDAAGAYDIERLFAEYVSRKVEWSAARNIRSHFGALMIDGVKVEIMGDVEKRTDEAADWEAPPDLKRVKFYVQVDEMRVPTMDLEYEYHAYLSMGRTAKAKLLREWLDEKRKERAMDFFEVVKTRQAIRAFQNKPLEPELIQQIFNVLNRAPSAGNLQAYEIFAVTRRESLDAMVAAARLKTRGQDYIAQAPIVLVFCAHPARSTPRFGSRGETLYCVQDATIACAYAQLAATALGLATVWIGSFDEAAVRQAIGVGDDLRPIVILPVGYAAEKPDESARRPVTDLVHHVD